MFKNMKDIKEFDNKIRQEWGSPIIFDGIIDIECYLEAKPKILWILKEGNEKNPNEDRNHREFHQDVTVYKGWKSTYKKIILTTYGILYNYDYLPQQLNENATMGENHENVLLKIAFINVNKNGGKERAKRIRIEGSYTNHRKVLIEQIKEINPDVIINCSQVERIYDDISSPVCYNLKKDKINNIAFSHNVEKLFINYYHLGCSSCPSAGIYTENDYCSKLINIYRYWKNNFFCKL